MFQVQQSTMNLFKQSILNLYTMKRISQYLSALVILLVCLTLLSVSCSTKNDPAPSSKTNNNTTNSGSTEYSTMCGDSICNLPYRVLSAFTPSGYWNTAETTTTLHPDSCGETPAYAGEGLCIVYTNNGGYWGASFLNNNNWTPSFKVNPNATKITFNMKIDYSANITFLAFGSDTYGKVEYYMQGTPVATPVWEKVTINLSAKPTGAFAAPLTVEIDGVTQSGKVTVVNIKDVLIE